LRSACIIYTTTGSLKEARHLSKIILKSKLAACIQISSAIESRYNWKGKTCKGKEYSLAIKTRTTLYKKIEACILANHTYELPQIVAVPVINGSVDYLKWLKTETL